MSRQVNRTRPGASSETRIAARTGAATVQFVRRNFYLGVVNGSLGRLRGCLLDPGTVGALLVVHLTNREALAGLMTTAAMLGLALPQLIVPGIASAMPRRRPLYIVSALTRTVVMWAMFALMFMIDVWPPMVVFALYLCMVLLFSLSVGIGITGFFDVVAKTIPPRYRGRFIAYRWFWGGVMGLAGGLLVRWLLKEEHGVPLPRTFQVLTGLGAIVGMASTMSFCFVKEPPGQASSVRSGVFKQVRWGFRLLRADPNLQRLMLMKLCGALAVCAVIYAGLFWKNVLGLAPAAFGFFIASRVAGELSNVFVMGRVSDRSGNRVTLISSSALLILVPPLLVLAHTVESHAFAIYMVLYFITGLSLGGMAIGGSNYPLEIAPEKRRPTYIAMVFISNAVFSFVPGGMGLLVPRIGYGGLFAAAMAGAVGATWFAWTLQEPRRGLRMKPPEGSGPTTERVAGADENR